MTHLGAENISYGSKKGRESFDFQPLKVNYRLDLLLCRWDAIYHWKALNKGYNFAINLISIRSLHITLWASKVPGVPISGILGHNDIWVQALWLSTKNIIRGKVVASPKSEPW
jgi:hypothetical protein